MIINHNLPAIFAHNTQKFKIWELDSNSEKLASGLRINRAADDAAGLALSEKMRSQIRGLRQAERNAEDGISFIQTAEGYLENIQNVLQRLRELAIQAANGIYTAEDRMQIQVEVSELVDEIDRVASHAQFNGLNMLTGRYAHQEANNAITASMWIHVGANMDQRERLFIGTMNTQGLGIKNPVGNAEFATFISFSTPNKANIAIADLDRALMKVSKQRADLGAYQNRLEFAAKSIMNGYQNLQAAESRIRDTDMAEMTVDFFKNQVLTQSANSMLSHANVRPQMVLELLR